MREIVIMKIDKKHGLFYILAISCQIILLYYSLTFLLFSYVEPESAYMAIPLFFVSIVPFILIILFEIFCKRNPKLIKYFLISIVVYMIPIFFLISDFTPTFSGIVVDKYTQEPIEKAEICYWIRGFLINPVESISINLKQNCIKTNNEGIFKIPRYIGFSPYTIVDELLLSVDNEGYEMIKYEEFKIGFNKFSNSSFPEDLNFELMPTSVELPDCYNIKNEEYLSECVSLNSMDYSLKTENKSYCKLSKDSEACNKYFNYINEQSLYGICTSTDINHRFNIFLYWDNVSVVNSITLYSVNNRSETIDKFRCFVERTSKPVFRVSVYTLSRSVNGCNIIKGFYANGSLYNTCGTFVSEMDKYRGETFTFPINRLIMQNSSKFNVKA